MKRHRPNWRVVGRAALDQIVPADSQVRISRNAREEREQTHKRK